MAISSTPSRLRALRALSPSHTCRWSSSTSSRSASGHTQLAAPRWTPSGAPFSLTASRVPTKVGFSRVAPAEYGAHFAHCMSREMLPKLRLPERLTGAEPGICETADPNTFFSLYQLYPDNVANNLSIPALIKNHPFVQLLYDSLRSGDGGKWVTEIKSRDFMSYGNRGRQFLFTDRGFMGLGPMCPRGQPNENGDVMLHTGSRVRKNDVVAVLAGGTHPWILRKVPNMNLSGSGSVYTIVGGAYVYGVTEGDLLQAWRAPGLGAYLLAGVYLVRLHCT